MIDRKTFHWPDGQLGAVSLTYDDGLASHFAAVAPQLETAGLRGTFNVPIMRDDFLRHTDSWREVAARGHELGNHTLFHPCRRDAPDEFPWLHEGYNLAHYTEQRFRDEVALANWILGQVDGQRTRTFANTCYHNWIGAGADRRCLESILPDYFIAARGEQANRAVDIGQVNYFNLGTVNIDFRTAADVQQEIEATLAAGDWIVYTAHGVGAGTHSLHMDAGEHQRLVDWLGANRDRVWTAPMVEVVRHLRACERAG